MTYEKFNIFCASLTAATYVVQWGGAHVWKVGGKIFAIGGWQPEDKPAFSFKTSDFDFEVLRGQPGFRPAPYLASRGMKWIQATDDDSELEELLRESHRLVSLGLTKKLQGELGLDQAGQ
ncbi:MAG: MmcQ/YjbR family DNA-binding protein [Granulosicoccaceae bacterium]